MVANDCTIDRSNVKKLLINAVPLNTPKRLKERVKGTRNGGRKRTRPELGKNTDWCHGKGKR